MACFDPQETETAMPIYAFQCQACGHDFDRLQKLSDPDPEACPACGEARVKRKITAPAFRLAGSGWYETDFKKDGDSRRNLADKGEKDAKAEKPAATEKPKPVDAPAASPAKPAAE